MTEEVESIKIAAITDGRVKGVRLTMGDKTLTMSPSDAVDLARNLLIIAEMSV